MSAAPPAWPAWPARLQRSRADGRRGRGGRAGRLAHHTPGKAIVKDLLTLLDLEPDQLEGLLDLATRYKARLRQARELGPEDRVLSGKTLAMVFTKPSLRTRVSFEVGMRQLGGAALYLSPAEVGLGTRESPEDVGRVLARYCDAIMARVFAHRDIEALAAAAPVPVINGLSDRFHPCQALADLLTIREAFGDLAGRRIAYVGDGNNVAHSLAVGGALAGAHVTIVHPHGFAPDPDVMRRADGIAVRTDGLVESTEELDAVEGVDVLYTDVWASMGQESEALERKAIFEPYRVDAALVARAADGAIVLHCLPAHRGDEITDEVMDGPQARVFDQAENRLHAQKAVLAWLVGGVELGP